MSRPGIEPGRGEHYRKEPFEQLMLSPTSEPLQDYFMFAGSGPGPVDGRSRVLPARQNILPYGGPFSQNPPFQTT